MGRIDREFIEKLKSWQDRNGDFEIAHHEADKLLVEFLRKLSYDELADEYEKVPKWYA